MALTPSVLFTGGQASTGATTMVTAQANAKTLVTKAVFTNTDTTARLLTLYIVRAGASASSANTLTYQKSLAAGATYEAFELENQLLNGGDLIQWKADAGSAVNCTGVSGYVIT